MFESRPEEFATSDLWGLLALGFSYPDPGGFELISKGTYGRDVGDCLGKWKPNSAVDIPSLIGGLRSGDGVFADFESDYLSCFHTNMPNPSASLFESHYVRGRDKSSILLELKAFYENFGLSVADDCELEDSLTGELEFLHFLSAREVQSRIDGTNEGPYVLAQRDFLNRHCAVWIPSFRQDVERKCNSDFFRSLAVVTDLAVARETERLAGVCGRVPSNG